MLSLLKFLAAAIIGDAEHVTAYFDVISAHIDAQKQLSDELYRLGGLVDTVDLSWSKDQPIISSRRARRNARAAAALSKKLSGEQAFQEEFQRMSHVHQSYKPSSFSMSLAIKWSIAQTILALIYIYALMSSSPRSTSRAKVSEADMLFSEEALRMSTVYESYQPDAITTAQKISMITQKIQIAVHSMTSRIRSLLSSITVKDCKERHLEMACFDEIIRLSTLCEASVYDGGEFVSSVCPTLESNAFNQVIVFTSSKIVAREDGFSLVGVVLPLTITILMVIPGQLL